MATHPLLSIRPALAGDVPLIRQLIAELAEYERLADAAVATDDGLREQLFGARPAAEVLIGEVDGEVMTGTRLIPTTAPHLLSEVFPHMANFRGIVRRPEIAEWTRGFITRKFREKGHGPIKGQFCGTVMEYCLLEGITAIGGVQETYWLPLWKRFRWTVRPVGNPREIDGVTCVAAFFDVTPAALVDALVTEKGVVLAPDAAKMAALMRS